MAESIAAGSTIEIQHKPSLNKESLHEGQLKTKEKVFDIFMYEDTGAVTRRVSEFLSELNMPLPDLPLDFQAVWFVPDELALCDDIETLLQELLTLNGLGNKKEGKTEEPAAPTFKFPSKKEEASSPFFPSQKQAASSPATKTPSYPSLFSLARALNQEKSAPLSQRLSTESFHGQVSRLPVDAPRNLFGDSLSHLYQAENQERGNQQSKDQHSRDQQEQEKEDRRQKEEKRFSPESKSKKGDKHFACLPTSCNLPMGEEKTLTQRLSYEASSSSDNVIEKIQAPAAAVPPQGGNIFFRFMALMARILGQAEAEAHDLYMRIKDRTDSIDVLTGLLSKINSSKGTMDASKDEELTKLIDRARELGVDIPKGKKTWSDDEKKLLKDNIHMRKDSMEKMTQLERTDMQRYLQEASQCHQARSNILKLHKEVMDTIIHNIRGT